MTHEGMMEDPHYRCGYCDGESAMFKRIMSWLEKNKNKIIDDSLIKRAEEEI